VCGATREIKEWQAIMDYLRELPVNKKGELTTIPVRTCDRSPRDQARLIDSFARHQYQP